MKKLDPTAYDASVRPMSEDGRTIYFAWFPQHGEAIHAVADDPETALRHAYETLAEAAEIAQEIGEPMPEPQSVDSASYSGRFSVRVSKALHRQLATCAERENLSLNAYVSEALARHATYCSMTGLTLREASTVRTLTSFTTLTAGEYDEIKAQPATKRKEPA